MKQNSNLNHKKFLSVKDVNLLIKDVQKDEGTVVFTNGCFDILHPGHVQYLEAARKLGFFLVVGLNSDDSVRRIKGIERPVCDETARAYMLASLSCVDAVVVFKDDTPEQLIQQLHPNILVKGADWEGKAVAGSQYVDRVEFMEFLPGWSTTDIISRVRKMISKES